MGRVYRITPRGEWDIVVEYDGEPNGLKIDREGRMFIADHRQGILLLDPKAGKVVPYLEGPSKQRFKGVNDLIFAKNGDLYFTDQGSTGLHDPTGCVYRYTTAGKLECLIDTVPSPNGIVFNRRESELFVAVTRANAVWRIPLDEGGRRLESRPLRSALLPGSRRARARRGRQRRRDASRPGAGVAFQQARRAALSRSNRARAR